MNKRASSIIGGEFMMLIVHLFFLIVVAFSIFTIISLGVSKRFDVSAIEDKIIFSAVYVSDCINHKDLRVYPGVIDLDKFQNNLDKCFKSKNFGSKLILDYDNRQIENFIDKRFFESESRFCPFRQYRCSRDINVPVIVNDHGILKQGRLRAEVILKNV